MIHNEQIFLFIFPVKMAMWTDLIAFPFRPILVVLLKKRYPRVEVMDANDEVVFPSESEECLCDLSKTHFRCVCNANCLQSEENLKCLELVGPVFFESDTETEFCLQQGHPTSPMQLMQVY